ncbi:Oidioi.mRNA.OKI2018_I69.chr1.g2020.t1.cds [Oikopleura dioica]|uniref:Oidioi.mRNA.OKI2018_I69.chr1.g2020.t1.cds n=1 Tax=Oikopleura dioica TaxID=34765 RepID=A0ABN7SYW4_OIKDI|nr:Oidioi.mRNA.OKI2018_I69.chr1.g2020.t1.cds [Oikopleura dioica]
MGRILAVGEYLDRFAELEDDFDEEKETVDLGEGSEVLSSLNDLVIIDADKNDVRIISNNVQGVQSFFQESKASHFQSLVPNGPDDILIMHDMKYWSMREIKREWFRASL